MTFSFQKICASLLNKSNNINTHYFDIVISDKVKELIVNKVQGLSPLCARISLLIYYNIAKGSA